MLHDDAHLRGLPAAGSERRELLLQIDLGLAGQVGNIGDVPCPSSPWQVAQPLVFTVSAGSAAAAAADPVSQTAATRSQRPGRIPALARDRRAGPGKPGAAGVRHC